MVRAYHAIFTAYGFWLPNDPRGSWSDFVRSWELLKHGRATTTNERRSLAHDRHDSKKRKAAKHSLLYPPVAFTGEQALLCIGGFAEAASRSGYVIHACSIMPDHVHVVVQRHVQKIETIVGQLKGEATKRLLRADRHPLSQYVEPDTVPIPSPWGRRCWKVFLNTDAQIRRAIRYAEENPEKAGHRRQRWSLVTPFDGG